VIGTAFNAAGIVAGGLAGLALRSPLSLPLQHRLRSGMAALAIYVGFSMAWEGLRAPLGHSAKQLGIALLALSVGSFAGWALRLQRGLNRLGEAARVCLGRATDSSGSVRPGDGFITCTILFCAGPLSLLGAVEDGLADQWRPLALKGVLDGFATMGLIATYGWSPLLAALPVLAYQGTLTLGARALRPWVQEAALLDSLNVTGGLIVACVAVLIVSRRQVPLTNYLPALLFAPLLTHWWG
jgi:uncharacterized protein